MEGSHNTRDLGGYASMDGGLTRLGRFVRSDTVQRLTVTGEWALVECGVRMIADLRLPVELETGPYPFASTSGYVMRLQRSLLDPEQPREIGNVADLAERYRFDLANSGARIAAIVETRCRSE